MSTAMLYWTPGAITALFSAVTALIVALTALWAAIGRATKRSVQQNQQQTAANQQDIMRHAAAISRLQDQLTSIDKGPGATG